MKQPIPHTNLKKSLGAVLFTLLFFLLSANSVVGQEITINKVAVENGTICNQFDITLEITGDPPARPQEVVLIIDRSGSMDDGPVPEPIDFAQEAAIDFIENFFDPANNPTGLNRVAIVSYAGSATLDQGLTGSSGEASLISTINSITTGGATNIAQAIQVADNELINNGTFDCATSRSIILLTDGVPTRNASGGSCSSSATSSSCINDAITAGVNAQTTTVGGEVFEQNVFTIGLIGAISGTQEATALSTLDGIQNSGAFSTEDNADLSGIYDVILGQLVAAARQLPGEALVSDVIDSNFAFVPGSFVASKGSATNAGQLVSWFVDEVVAETITLQYSIVSATSDVCGINTSGVGVINYEDSNCEVASQVFNNPNICVPCPEITASIERDGCTNDIIYTGTFDEGDCASLSDSFQWEFFLNDVSVGTATSLSGTFTYSGAAPFEGDFRGELTYTGTYGSGCILDPLEADSTINIPSPPQVASVVTDVLCFGDSTGAIDITVTEGTPPYTYSWSNGATTEDISGLAAGSYTVTVTDADGCNNVTTSAIVVSEPNEPLEITADITDVACFGENTGAIDVSVTGGTAPYTYSWDSGETTQDLSGLAAGVYELTVTDANGCSDGVASFTVGQPIAALSESAAITDAACFGEATGAIDLTVAGGTAPYTYSWSNGAITEDISGLATGDYTVDIEDANGCMLSQTYTVGQPAAALSESASITDAACFGEATGAIDLTVAGGTAPYTYSWSNGASTEDISGLAAGDYTVDIEDANGCMLSQTYTVGQPTSALSESATITDAACFGEATGAIDLTVAGGTAPYTYSWSNGASTEDISGLAAGDYTVDIEDANGCMLSQTYTVGQPAAALSESATITDAACFGETTGAIDLTVAGGTAPYTYSWSNGASTEDISGLAAGDYTVDIEDANGCMLSQTYTVGQPTSALSESATITDAACFGEATGAIDLTVAGGTAPYTYSWSNGASTEDISGLAAGDYTVDIEDANGCMLSQTYTVGQPAAALSESATITDAACFGETTGAIDLTVAGGTAPYTYSWSNGASTEDISGLAAGDYTVDIEDANGCMLSQTYTVGQPTAGLSESAAITDAACFGEATGAIDLTVAGGTAPYTYSWSNGASTEDISGLTAGDYTVDIEDANGCMLSQTYTVGQPTAGLSAGIDSQVNIVCGSTLGSVVVSASGGTAPYQYSLNGGAFVSSGSFVDLAPGNYTVDVEDANGCTTSVPVFIINSCIAIVKTGIVVDTDADNCADDGESINYTFIVTNEGNTPITGVSVTDPLVAGISFSSGDTNGNNELDIAESWVYTGSYVIDQDDIDLGTVTNQATANGTTSDTAVSDDSDDSSVLEDDPTVTTLCQGAAIAIVKTGVFVDGDADNCADEGESINYTFTVTNQGNVSLTDVSVTDPLIAPIAFVSGDTDADGELDVTETWIYSASYTITQGDIDAGQVSNQAEAEGTSPTGIVRDFSDDDSVLENEPTVTPLCQNPAIAIVKSGVFVDGDADSCADEGESINYTFTVTNQGNVSLTDVSVTDPLIAPIAFVSGDTDADGELDVTETWIYSASYTITQGDIDAGQVSNQAEAEGTSPTGIVRDFSDDDSVLENEPTVTPLCQNPAIAIVKSGVFVDGDADNCADDGESINYTFTVTNQGNVSLSSVTVTDPLVGTITFASGDTDSDGELDVTETWTYTGSYTITQDDIDNGSVSNQALAQGTAPDSSVVEDDSDDSSVLEDDPTVTDLCQNPAIAIVKSGVFVDGDADSCADDGESINYTFTVTNQGNVSLSSVTVTDPLVGTITFASGDTDSDGELDVTETWTYTGSYTITQDDVDNGSVSNQALAQGTAPDSSVVEDDSDDNSVLENDPTVTTLCNNAAIAIVKTGVFVDGDADSCADDGESINYTFTVTNQGNVSLSSVTVTDPLVGTITFASGDTDADGELDVTETWTYTGSYTITQDDIDNGSVSNQALAQGTAPDSSVVEDDSDDSSVLEDDPTVTDLCQNPAIAIVKSGVFVDGNGDNCADDGESISYTFTVTNQGNVSLSSVTVTDPLVGTITFASGDTDADGELDVTETWTYTGSYTITQDDIDNGSVSNQALAQGTAPDSSVVEDDSDDSSILEDDPTVTTLCNNAAIAIVKTGVFVDGDADSCADDGESINYTFTVTNQGNVSLSSVTVTDPLVGTITFASGDTDADGELDVTETWTYTGSYTITQDDIDNGSVSNQALAQGTAPDSSVVEDDSDDSSVLEDDPTVTDLCQNPAIAIVKTGVFVDGDGDNCSDDGESIDYTFVVTNEGNVSLSSVSVTDPLIASITFVSGDTDADGELDVDETWTYTGSYTIDQDDIDAGQVANQATASALDTNDNPVSDLSDDSSVLEDDPTVTPLCNGAAIAIVKSGVFNDENADSCADPTETITYTFTVTNAGNVSLSDITVTDPLVSPITFVSGDTDADGELDVDETWIYTGSYVITQDDIDAGQVTNQATAAGQDPSDNIVDDLSDESSVAGDDPTVTPLCQDPIIAIVKSGVFNDENADSCADPTETITYTFTVTNEGNVSLSDITVTDPLVSPITFVSGDTDADGELDVDETWIYTGSYAITQDDIDAGQVVNQATAAGLDTNDNPVSDESDDTSVLENDPTTTPLCQQPVIAIVKTGVFVDGNGDNCADDGESINYTFVVTNEGNVSLTSISVTDPLVGTITFASGDTDADGELDVDETWTYTGSYTITQDDIDAGMVTNQALAQGTAPDASVVEDESDDNSVLEDDPTVTDLCQAPAIAIVKTGVFVDGNGNNCADDGESIDYTFVVTNEGNVSLASISVTDPLITTITFVDGDTDADGELDVTETWTYTGSYTIDQDDIDAGGVTNQALAQGTAPDASVVEDESDDSSVLEDDPTVTPLCNGAAIAIVKTGIFVDGNGDNCADDGESINYTFVVTNEGNVSLASISVTDPLVGTITFVDGDTDADGELDVTETWTYTGSYTITQDDIDAGMVTNQALAQGTAPDASVVEDQSDDNSVLENDPTVTDLCQEPAIAIVKTGVFVDGNGDNCADDGESINYTFTVTNQGNVSLASISVTDPLVGTITFVDGDTDADGELDVTETWTYTGSYTITQDDIDAGQVTNQAIAQGTAPDASVVEDLSDNASEFDNDPTVVELCQNPIIAIVKTGVFVDGNGDNCADEGETINYTFVVTNEGNESLSAILVTDPLVSPITFVGGDTDADGELDVDETWIYTGTYTITQDDIDAGQVTNQASAAGDSSSRTVFDDSDDTSVLEDDPTVTDLCQNPAIAIVKTGVFVDGDGDNCADDGESIDYTFVVTNEGNVSLASISVTDPLLATITFVDGDTDADGELDVDETWTYTGSYTIDQDDIDAGGVTNQALAQGTAPDASVVEDESDDSSVLEDDPTVTPLCNGAAIAIVKTGIFVDGNGDNCADDGEAINYTFVVTNEGNVSLSGITVTDPLVGTITFVDGDTDADGELDVDEVWTYTGSYTITQDDIDTGMVTNQATAEGTAPDGTVVSDLSDNDTVVEDDPTITELCQEPAIAIVKSGIFVDGNGDNCADDGESINYTFVVTNEGNVSLASITVTDPLVGTITFVDGDTDADGELDVDEAWTYTGSYVITQDDIDAGMVTNQALAQGTAPDSSVVEDESDDNSVLEDDPTVTDLCQEPAIAIVKTGIFVDGNGDNCADDGETIEYTFTVTNEGNVSLSDITVTDPLVGTITFVDGDTDADGELDVTQTWTYTGTYIITQDDIDAGMVTNQALAQGTAPDSSIVEDESDDASVLENDPTVTELCQEPAIAIVKTGIFIDGNGDNCADAGETIEYTFVVTNEGNVSLSGITVTDPLVGTITFVDGDTDADGELDVDETWTYTGTYTITPADIDAGEVVNQATAEGTAPDGSVVTDESGTAVDADDPTVTELCQNPAIAIVKTGIFVDGDGDDCADDGETIEYTFVVTNEGNVSLSGITVTDPLVGTITFVDGDTDADGELDVDETWTYTGSYTITQDDIDAGEVENQGTAEGTAPDGTVVSDLSDNDTVVEDDPTITELCQEPAIAIVKSGIFVDGNGDNCANSGETIEYTFVVTNEGNVSLSGITVTDILVAPITFVDGDTDGDGELDVDETWTYTGTYTITPDDIDAGEVVNQATAEGSAPDGTVVTDESGTAVDTDDSTITELCQNPLIAIVKAGLFVDGDGDDCADDGETIEYSFVVTNEGNVSLSGIIVTDPLVGTITFVDGDTDGDGELDVDETWTYTGTYVITQDDIDAGEVENQATAEGTAPDGTVVDDLSDNDSVLEDDPTITELCQDPAIAIVKTGVFVDGNGDDCADEGEIIEYTFVVTNEGNVSLSGITVTDPLVGTITFVDGDTDGDGELDVDETWTYTGTYVITQDDIDAGEVENQATAEGTAPDGTLVSDLSDDDSVLEDDPTITELCQNPAIAIVKTGVFVDGDGDGCANEGEIIEYTFVVTNEGNVSLSGITVTDPLIGTITFVDGDTDGDGELDVDEAWTYTGTYAITLADIDAGEVENQATAEGTAPDGTLVSDESGATVSDDDPTITDLCQGPAIALIKIGTLNDENGDGCTDVGETITYQFIVTNTGNVTLTDINIVDVLVAVDGGPITLAPGEVDDLTFTATYTVTLDDVNNGFVINQAEVFGTAPDGTEVSDLSDDNSNVEDDVTEVDLCQNGSIEVEKIGVFNDDNGDGEPQVGETITYTFIVTNTGNVTVFDIVIEDPLVAVTGGPITLEPGEVDDSTFTATYALTEADIEAGQVVNQAIGIGMDQNGNEVRDLSDDPMDTTDNDAEGDGEPDDPTVVILPEVLGVDFEIFNAVSPDGNGLNDFFRVQGIEQFPDNNMQIFNRWGVLVYETDGYGGADGQTNVFRGISEGRVTVRQSKELPTGTYYYVLRRFVDGETLTNAGYLYVNRK